MIQYGLHTGNALDMADAAVAYLQSFLRQLGPIALVDGYLCAGSMRLQGDHTIVDMIKERFGFGCTIFQGNERIATTAMARGSQERALGTKANEKITQQVYRRGEIFRGITRTLDKEWVIVYAPLRGHSGRLVGMIACFRELLDFLSDLVLLDCTSEAVLLLDTTGRLLDANSTACDMLGLSRTELMTRHILDVTEGLNSRDLLLANTETKLHPISFEGFWRRDDGHKFPVTMSLCQLMSKDGPVLLGIVRDFTEEYEAREKLRMLNQRLAQVNASLEVKVAARTKTLLDTLTKRDAMLDQLTDGLIATNESGAIELVNPAMIAMMGWESIDPRGMPLSILHDALAELVIDAIVRQLSFQDTLLLPNDEIGEASISAIVIEDASHAKGKRCIGCVLLMRREAA